MSFVAWYYPFFLALMVLLYWQLPLRPRLAFLLAGSYVFYACWDVRFLALVFTSTVIDYLGGLAIGGRRFSLPRVALLLAIPVAWFVGCRAAVPAARSLSWVFVLLAPAAAAAYLLGYELLWRCREDVRRRRFLQLSLASNLLILGFFKYFGFFAGSLHSFLGWFGAAPSWTLPAIILPIGISFYTFQSMSYALDVYRGRVPPCADFLNFSAYVCFFPQLVAGPIERSGHLLPQLLAPGGFEPRYLHEGVRLLLIGAFKKLFVADNCALLANYVFGPALPRSAPWALLGVLAFAFQIYGDFSGYTDLARGSARLFGVTLAQNFQFPYFAVSPADFWRRWHISLSTWFRDYLYIPLGGNRGSRWLTLRNLLLTMLLAGLWHGASWMFVLWGLYHGLLLVAYRVAAPLRWLEARAGRSRGMAALAMLAMFLLTLAGWSFFRCANLAMWQAWLAALGSWGPAAVDWKRPAVWLAIHAAPLLLLQAVTWQRRDEADLDHVPWVARAGIYLLLILLIVSSTAQDQEFIYFQF